MTTAPQLPAATEGPLTGGADRHPVAIRYSIGGDLRFLAHHDELRMLSRAVVRARWPMAFSHGFNPRPLLKLPLPRNLGTASSCQVAVATLRERRSSDELAESLRCKLPRDCELQGISLLAAARTPHPQSVCYEVELGPEDAEGRIAVVGALVAQGALVIERDDGPAKPRRTFDIRPYIDRLEIDGTLLRMTLQFIQQRTARPSEVITALGLAAEAYVHRLRRAAVQWDLSLAGPEVGPATMERNELDYKEVNREES